MPVVSNTKPTLGRVLHVYAARQWSGPRAGIVAMAWPDSGCANVNVALDGCNDAQLLSFMRASPEGNTLPSIPVYDPLTDEERKAIATTLDYWAEWMPYQVSQQQAQLPARVDDLERIAGSSSARLGDVENLAGELKRANDEIDSRLSEAESKLQTVLTQFADELRNIPNGSIIAFPTPRFSLAEITRSNHEKWLAGGDRSYSPFNKPYDQLTVDERRQISLTVRNTFDALIKFMGVNAELVDDFDAEAHRLAMKNDAASVKAAAGSET